ncbi:MAG: hypothetical protein Q8K31_01960 [Burkholderiaceae bacterium]|nr:hypothetical protein [Burkholderiaceae bacterium]
MWREEEYEGRQVRRQKVRAQMCSQVRSKGLSLTGQAEARASVARAARLRLLETYAGLARRGQHLLSGLLDGQGPRQWEHYPKDDAVDALRGFQWFYHSHAPQDRPGSTEHGHIHLFLRRKLWSRRLRSAQEVRFSALGGGSPQDADTRHALAIGFDAKGLATSLFMVNSWVTGDRMLSARTTASLLEGIALDTGHTGMDAVITSIVQLYADEIGKLLRVRDARLFAIEGESPLDNESLEILSEIEIDVDGKLASDL